MDKVHRVVSAVRNVSSQRTNRIRVHCNRIGQRVRIVELDSIWEVMGFAATHRQCVGK